ncbi:MAG: hypothetical protein VKL39_01850 [Leptolyngbyaceae bacterium]|nr:hypothetical protein [Leptolyngbyaceae bacterium]
MVISEFVVDVMIGTDGKGAIALLLPSFHRFSFAIDSAINSTIFQRFFRIKCVP